MAEVPTSGPLSPVARTTYYYLTMYMVTGATSAYLPIWLTDRGMSQTQIGWLNAVPILLLLLLNVFVGRISDRLADWRTAIIVGSMIAGVTSLGLMFELDFWGLMLVWVLTMVPFTAIVPVADAATIRMTRRTGQGEFAVIRAWGTVGHTAVSVLTGVLVGFFTSAIFVPLIIGISLLRAGLSLQLPRFRAPAGEAAAEDSVPPPAHAEQGAEVSGDLQAKSLREVMKPWFLLPIVGAAAVFATHIMLMGFGALVWKNAGISESMIGLLIAVGAGAEALMMFGFRRIGLRFSARALMLFAAVVAALRWGIMAFEPPLAVLFALQLLHSVTFAVNYLGAVNFIANWTSEDIAAEAQSFFVVLQQGLAIVSLLAFGFLAEYIGAKAFFAAAVMAAVAALFALLSLRMMGPRKAD